MSRTVRDGDHTLEIPMIRLRVAGILIEDGRILLARHRKHGREYHLLPGGGVEFGESLAHALVREMQEEAGLQVAVGPLVMVNDGIAPDGTRHGVQLAFHVTRTGGELRSGRDDRLDGVEWAPLDSLDARDLRPPIAGQIVEAYRAGFPHRVQYLGNFWRE